MEMEKNKQSKEGHLTILEPLPLIRHPGGTSIGLPLALSNHWPSYA